MIKIEQVVLLSLLALCACNAREAGIQRSINQYYDLKGLIESQVSRLDSLGLSLQKNAIIDGNQDKTDYKPDSAQWGKELNFFLEADINKTTLLKSYRTEEQTGKSGKKTLYISKRPTETDVDTLEIDFDPKTNFPKVIKASLKHRNKLFSSFKRLRLVFRPFGKDDVLLHKFVIEGGQKMITKDTTTFRIEAKVSTNQ